MFFEVEGALLIALLARKFNLGDRARVIDSSCPHYKKTFTSSSRSVLNCVHKSAKGCPPLPLSPYHEKDLSYRWTPLLMCLGCVLAICPYHTLLLTTMQVHFLLLDQHNIPICAPDHAQQHISDTARALLTPKGAAVNKRSMLARIVGNWKWNAEMSSPSMAKSLPVHSVSSLGPAPSCS